MYIVHAQTKFTEPIDVNAMLSLYKYWYVSRFLLFCVQVKLLMVLSPLLLRLGFHLQKKIQRLCTMYIKLWIWHGLQFEHNCAQAYSTHLLSGEVHFFRILLAKYLLACQSGYFENWICIIYNKCANVFTSKFIFTYAICGENVHSVKNRFSECIHNNTLIRIKENLFVFHKIDNNQFER